MPQGLEFEFLLYLPSSAFEARTGDEDYEHCTPVSYESYANEAGWAPTDATEPGKFTGEDVPPGNRRPT